MDPAGNPISESPSPVAGDSNDNPSKRFLVDLHTSSGAVEGAYPVTFNNKPYDRTISVGCGPYDRPIAWPVVGYSQFSATIGVDDDAEAAIGTQINVSFTNQDNQALGAAENISLGRSRTLTFPLKGAVQMQLSCKARGAYEHLDLSLGDAAVTR